MQLLGLRKRRITRKLLTDLQMNLAFGMLLIQNLMNTRDRIILFVCVLNRSCVLNSLKTTYFPSNEAQ